MSGVVEKGLRTRQHMGLGSLNRFFRRGEKGVCVGGGQGGGGGVVVVGGVE